MLAEALMTETSIAEAKTQLTRLIQQAERGEAVHITRRGKPVAVLLSEDEYRGLCRPGAQADDRHTAIAAMREFPKVRGQDAAVVSRWIGEGHR
jgi:prevent-host-death family protein